MLCCPIRPSFKASRWLPGGTRRSWSAPVESNNSSLRRATFQTRAGQTPRARLVLDPLKISSVPASRNERITVPVIARISCYIDKAMAAVGFRRYNGSATSCRPCPSRLRTVCFIALLGGVLQDRAPFDTPLHYTRSASSAETLKSLHGALISEFRTLPITSSRSSVGAPSFPEMSVPMPTFT